ncbi:molecular chaperone TorD family protein [Billgrantia sp. LNSP4103-1]|uniref:molecular chaperone TorD family protein n=1 Tax=Billgrantia sp. LNSP4103-1 TaxID=3410266 RepID=UPI00403F33E7
MLNATDPLASAELYLCLSKAFMMPTHRLSLEDLHEAFVPDLHELAVQLPSLSEAWLNRFDEALSGIASSQQLLLGYSRLFLMPPAPAPLNLMTYIDENDAGRGCHRIEAFYHRHQLIKSSDFHDSPDHLGLNLQWLAWVLSRWQEAQPHDALASGSAPPYAALEMLRDLHAMVREITLPAIGRMQQGIATANGASRPEQKLWQLLIDLTNRQLQHDLAWWASLDVTTGIESRNQEGTSEGTHHAAHGEDAYGKREIALLPLTCRICGNVFTPDTTVAEMCQRLEAAGLSAAHLEICVACRDKESQPTQLTPPGASHRRNH